MLHAQLGAAARPRPSRVSRAGWPIWAALPVAAALAGLLVLRQDAKRARPPRIGSPFEVRQPVETPVVNAPANRDVAVFKVTDKVTVVWDLGVKGGS
jgi:hypothetical protein